MDVHYAFYGTCPRLLILALVDQVSPTAPSPESCQLEQSRLFRVTSAGFYRSEAHIMYFVEQTSSMVHLTTGWSPRILFTGLIQKPHSFGTNFSNTISPLMQLVRSLSILLYSVLYNLVKSSISQSSLSQSSLSSLV